MNVICLICFWICLTWLQNQSGLPMVALIQHESKYKVYKLHQRYILKQQQQQKVHPQFIWLIHCIWLQLAFIISECALLVIFYESFVHNSLVIHSVATNMAATLCLFLHRILFLMFWLAMAAHWTGSPEPVLLVECPQPATFSPSAMNTCMEVGTHNVWRFLSSSVLDIQHVIPRLEKSLSLCSTCVCACMCMCVCACMRVHARACEMWEGCYLGHGSTPQQLNSKYSALLTTWLH